MGFPRFCLTTPIIITDRTVLHSVSRLPLFITHSTSTNTFCFLLLEDIKEEMKLNKNITSLLSEAKTKFSDDEHEVKLYFPECFLCLLSFVTFVSSQTKNRDLRLKDKDEV